MNERLPEVESAATSTACPHCGGTGVVDSGGLTPRGSAIDIPCPSCHESDRNKLAAFGASWISDSSLERWFPITAEELAKARATIAQMEKLLKEGLTAAEGAETTMQAWAEYEVGTDPFNNDNFCRLLDWQKSVKLVTSKR